MREDPQREKFLILLKCAGILAAKKTSELIPLSHNINLSNIDIEFIINKKDYIIEIYSTVSTSDKTGVEIEALIACSISAITIYDMCKSIDKSITVENLKLTSKPEVNPVIIKMISFKQYENLIKKNIKKSLATEFVEITNAYGRILAENIFSDFDFPNNNQSSMDGAVIHSKDKKRKFKIIGESKAGDKQSKEFNLNQCKLIYTGAPIPGNMKKLVIPKENFLINKKITL